MNEKFSVLMAVYKNDNPQDFRVAVESVTIRQTLKPSEVLVIVDGPVSQSLAKIIGQLQTEIPYMKAEWCKENRGLGLALQYGMERVSYELVARMDSDDIAMPDRFEKQIKIFNKYPDLDVVGAGIKEFEGNIQNIVSERNLPEYSEDIYKFAKERCPVNHPVVMFRKSAVLAAGGYIHFPLFEDYYLWVRMLMNGAKFYNIQECLLYFRLSPDMFRRRGGWKYAIDELRFQQIMKSLHFISLLEFIKNIFIRFSVRIMPNSLRTFIYKKMLR